jgi:hypothetical protein
VAAFELGAFFTTRTLGFTGVGPMSGTLHGLTASSIIGPAARLEVFPLASAVAGWAGGFGLVADAALSTGLEVEVTPAERRTARLIVVRGALAWRSPAMGGEGVRLALVPALGWAVQRFSTDPLVDGLADAELAGPSAGLTAELTLGTRFGLSASGRVVRWLTARDLVEGDPAFFPGGSALATEAELGLAVRVAGPLWFRLLGEWSLTRYTLDADPSGTYAARRASDELVGARAALRVEL